MLNSGRAVRRALPVNLRQADLHLFSHELEREIPPAKLLEIRGVRVSPDGVLFKGFKILPESFASQSNYRWRVHRILAFHVRNYLLRQRRVLEGNSLWITDDWSGGYFHWLADSLPRLYTIREEARSMTLLLPSLHESLGFVLPSLAPFGLRDVRFIGPGETFVCEHCTL